MKRKRVLTSIGIVGGALLLIAAKWSTWTNIPVANWDAADYVVGIDATGPSNRTFTLGDMRTWCNTDIGTMNFITSETATLVSGVATVTQSQVVIAAEADTSPLDDLVTITQSGVAVNDWVIIRPDTGDTITVKDGTGNIDLGVGSDATLDDVDEYLVLQYDGAEYDLIFASPNLLSIAMTDLPVIQFSDQDASPDAVGELLYDNTVTGITDGALAWYDDDAVRYLVDLAVLPSDDDYVVAYDADADGFYMKEDGGGSSGTLALVDDGAVEAEGTADALADDKYQAFKMIGGRNAGENITQWDLVYLNPADGEWHQADADESEAAGKAWGIATTAGTDSNPIDVIVSGIIRNEGWSWSAAAVDLFVSDTAGEMTETAPSTSGDVVKIVARTLSDSEIYLEVTHHFLVVE